MGVDEKSLIVTFFVGKKSEEILRRILRKKVYSKEKTFTGEKKSDKNSIEKKLK